MNSIRNTRLILPLVMACLPLQACNSTSGRVKDSSTIASTLATSDARTRAYNDHVVVLSSEWMEGRVPGSRGISLAEEYIAWNYQSNDLEPAFDSGSSYRQQFKLRNRSTFSGQGDSKVIDAFNTGAMIPGSGALAGQWIVVGAHHDHLGTGTFGSRGTEGKIHPGADDNASGTAAILLLGEHLGSRLAELGDVPRRSILLMTFSGEESGLNGSAHYVQHPIAPIEDHVLMINFDMIGRIEDGRVSVTGSSTGQGLDEILATASGDTVLEIATDGGLSSRSDHASFHDRGVPVLFVMASSLNEDYHTEQDQGWKLNRVDAARTSRFIEDVILLAAVRPDRFEFSRSQMDRSGSSGPGLSEIKVRFGIKPGNYADPVDGILVGGVSAGTSAEEAGLQAGDRMILWNEQPIVDIGQWMTLLAACEPGDIVDVTVLRDGGEVVIPVKLKAKN